MRKIIELDIILPYYEAKYKVGEKITVYSMNSDSSCYVKEIVKEIKKTDINCGGNDYLITTETGKEIWIFEGQPGLQVIWENKNN
jgi:hypothetical protein|nr:MAG TPA: hypothetical protein [Caudoviricetes sp.]